MANKAGNRLWWQTGVIYQIYPRSFQDSNGDGIGDLAGIIQRLDYLSDTLGVDALWLSPFYPSPQADFGYDVSDYTGIDPQFGDLATFDRLVDELHRRDIRLIIDFVPNHSSAQHPWFVESRSSRDNPKRDWYVWRDAKPDGSPPNNWLSNFGGPAWDWDEKTAQYYLHCFLKEQPDLNWRNPDVKAAMFEAVRFWLERGVDGFRLDVAHYIMKDPELRDNPLNPNPAPAKAHDQRVREYDRYLHVHSQGHADVHGVFREFRTLLDEYSGERPRYSVGEIHIFDWPSWAAYYGARLDELHMPFNFSLLKAPWQAKTIRDAVEGLEAALPEGAWPNYVLGNHDEPRLAGRYGRDQARVAAMLLLTLRGTPTLYYGDEVGMTNVAIPPEEEQDPFGLREPGFGRDLARTPMQWDASPNAGFADPQVNKLWLPLAPDYQEYNVARQVDDPMSFLSLYRRLLRYRRATPALQWGSFRALDPVAPAGQSAEHCFVFMRQAGVQRVVLALNFSAQEQAPGLAGMGTGKVVVSTHLDRDGAVALAEFRLRANEGLMVAL